MIDKVSQVLFTKISMPKDNTDSLDFLLKMLPNETEILFMVCSKSDNNG